MFDQFFALVLFALIATGSPGGATTLATASGARFGLLRSIPLITGIALTLSGLVAVSCSGLATTLQAAPALNLIVKALGTVYLLWLAVKLGFSGAPNTINANGERPLSFINGAMLLLVNPKAWAMALGVASSFSQLVSDPILLGGLLAAVFALSALLSLTFWALTGRLVSRVLSADWHWHIFNGGMAGLLAVSILQLWV
ncbi:LysE family transporter [Ruegeria sp. 2205SS24-7]|uniref:LysE family translocator n=1 Tax=Ruegeria discodermiae TaxID=3064389 RepID=UPI0027404EF8|nr:LysE family transporter [Ruegeria sp. 2205SS24-7]MDP5218752.1 LysE family transporter [Ruegeria sp. 2205SS24-7]